jgi:hypothetical protein
MYRYSYQTKVRIETFVLGKLIQEKKPEVEYLVLKFLFLYVLKVVSTDKLIS